MLPHWSSESHEVGGGTGAEDVVIHDGIITDVVPAVAVITDVVLDRAGCDGLAAVSTGHQEHQ
jgi:hypothetical protein